MYQLEMLADRQVKCLECGQICIPVGVDFLSLSETEVSNRIAKSLTCSEKCAHALRIRMDALKNATRKTQQWS